MIPFAPLAVEAVPRPGRAPEPHAQTPAAARRVGEEFEALFLAQMLSPLFEGVATDGPLGGGQAERMIRSFQVDEFAKAIARRGGIGIADAVVREILRTQERSHG
ncbi:MAG: rod-binding protein [Pseudomonadota bacterium]